MTVLEVLFFFIFGIWGMYRLIVYGDGFSYALIAGAVLCLVALVFQMFRDQGSIERFKENQGQQSIELEKQKIELEKQRLELEKQKLELERQKAEVRE